MDQQGPFLKFARLIKAPTLQFVNQSINQSINNYSIIIIITED